MQTETNGTGAARAVAAPKPNTEVRTIPIPALVESKTNPRKTFRGLDELAASIKQHGLLAPLLVRAIDDDGVRFEIVFGARRYRATKLAGITSIRCEVRSLNDREVLELQLVENLQREDMHPLEEADGYAELRKTLSIEEIAAKVGRPATYIHQRSKLSALCEPARKAFYEDKIDAAKALLLARIPHADLQKDALKEITTTFYNGELPSYASALRTVQDRYMLRIADAPFATNDTKLNPAAGACGPCPKRTANQKLLFADMAKADDMCSDPKCWRVKLEAAWTAAVESAKVHGHAIMKDAETRKVLGATGHVIESSGYVDLDVAPLEDAKGRTWLKLLGDAVVPITVARDERGGVHMLADKEDALKVCREKGFAFAAPKKKSERKGDTDDRDAQKRRARIMRALIGAVAIKAERAKMTDKTWRALARAMIRATWAATLGDVIKRREIDVGKRTTQDALLDAAAKMKAPELVGLCFELVVARNNAFEIGPALKEAAAALDVDVAKIAKDSALEEKKADAAPPEKPKAKKAGKKK